VRDRHRWRLLEHRAGHVLTGNETRTWEYKLGHCLKRESGHGCCLAGDDESVVAFINTLNAEWVDAMRRTSPRVLADVYALASTDLTDWIERIPGRATAVSRVVGR
jgi:hypothetical protein